MQGRILMYHDCSRPSSSLILSYFSPFSVEEPCPVTSCSNLQFRCFRADCMMFNLNRALCSDLLICRLKFDNSFHNYIRDYIQVVKNNSFKSKSRSTFPHFWPRLKVFVCHGDVLLKWSMRLSKTCDHPGGLPYKKGGDTRCTS